MRKLTVLLAMLAAANGYPSFAQTEQVRFGNLHAHTFYIELVAPDGTVVQVVSYGEIGGGDAVTAGSS